MRKLYLELGTIVPYYQRLHANFNVNFDLHDVLWMSFDDQGEIVDVDQDQGIIIMHNLFDIKKPKWSMFEEHSIPKEQYQKFRIAYEKYWNKRWNEIPKIKITKQNYEKILHEWKECNQKKSKYVVIQIDDQGWISLIPQDTLTPEDLELIAKDQKLYDAFQKKQNEYLEFYKHKPYKNNIWSSPADSEFYSDFLTEDEMVWKKK